jgi:acyl-CoA thioester hydrolase
MEGTALLKCHGGAGIIGRDRKPGGALLEHRTKTRVRYADTDQMGCVHHAKYFEYFEIGRTEYMRRAGISYADMERMGYFLMLVDVHATYRKAVGYDTELAIRTRVGELGKAQVTFHYIVEDEEGSVLCEGWTKLACTDKSGRLRRIPEEVRKILKGDGE